MAQVINTNVASLNAQRNLNASQSSLATSLERLSSGLRINSAKDDAAGLAISERFTTQIRGLNQAIRNANDGISLSQTAEGSLGEISNNLQRIRELAVQSANATNSDSDRAALDQEVQQRLAEIDRIASQTSFNGRKILDGSFGNGSFQVGANVGETISLDLNTSMRTGAVGSIARADSVDLGTIISPDPTAATFVSGVIADFDFASTPTQNTVTAIAGTASSDAAEDFILEIDSVEAVNVSFAQGTSVADNAAAVDADFDAFITASNGAYSIVSGTLSGGDLVLEKADGTAITFDTSNSTLNTLGSMDGVAASITESETQAGDTTNNKVITVDGGSNITLTSATEEELVTQLQAALDAQDDGAYSVSSTGGQVTIATTATGASATAPAVAGADAATFTTGAVLTDGVDAATLSVAGFSIQIGDNDAITIADQTFATPQAFVDTLRTAVGGNATVLFDSESGEVGIVANDDITIAGTFTDANDAAVTVFSSLTAAVDTNGLSSTNVTSVDGANDTLLRIDTALTAVSDLRSTFGAIQNRFESTIANLGSTVENLSASRSRILDADFASETANLTRAQILQQAGISILSQANALPQSVLGLLG